MKHHPPKAAAIRLTYDEQADALSFAITPSAKSTRTLELTPDVFVDIDRLGAVINVEVLGARGKYAASFLDALPEPFTLLTLTQAAKVAGLSPATLRKQIHNSRLKATKQGRDWFVPEGALHDYLRSRAPQGRRTVRRSLTSA